MGTGKILVIAGAVIMLTGIMIWLAGNRLNWFGNLPGDIKVERENFRFYMPLTSMILLSAVVSLLWWLIRNFFL